jgi:transcriptional antiterminator RfaH
MAKHWYALYTKPKKEQLVCTGLEQENIPTFLPKIQERPHRGKGSKVVPLFPCYIFVNMALPDEYFKIRWKPGVKRIVGYGDTPIPIDDYIISFLQNHTSKSGMINPISTHKLKMGKKVRILSGALRGLVGIIENPPSASGRVSVLMELIGGQNRVEVPCSMIEAL